MILPKAQAGFTLIEVLVALIVVAIGLLGLANLQTIGLHNNHGTNLMSQAMWLANDISDRARSNINPNQPFYTDNYNDSKTYKCDEKQSQPDPMAAKDRQEWQDTICRVLPNARITLCTSSDPYASSPCTVNSQIKGITPYMVKLEWDDPAQPGGRQKLIITFQVTRVPDPDNLDSYLTQYQTAQ